jgi:hypothetical protein
MKMKALSFIIGFVGLSVLVICSVIHTVELQSKLDCHWSLADKSSTLEAKLGHIDNFVAALQKENLQGTYSSRLIKTPDNSFDANMAALLTLKDRLTEAQGMDPNSMAYQQAIQQITAQEQGAAHQMISAIYGSWWLAKHPTTYGWVPWALTILFLLIMLISTVLWFGD